LVLRLLTDQQNNTSLKTCSFDSDTMPICHQIIK
jgi:hypothetical protein